MGPRPALFQWAEIVKHFWMYFSVEEADPRFQLLPLVTFRKASGFLAKLLKARDKEDAPWSKSVYRLVTSA